jgi:ABC-type multidrug transport system permease subunit
MSVPARIFANQLKMGLIFYLREPSAVFWITAFPVVMLLALGTVFGGGKSAGVKLLWEQAAPATHTDSLLSAALAEQGIRVETAAPADAEARWKLGKLPAMLLGNDGHYTLRVNSYLTAQAMQTAALVQEQFLVAQARALGSAEPKRIPVVMSSPGGHQDGPYAAYLLPGLMGLNLVMIGVFFTGIVDVSLRAKGGYKRLATTPLPRPVYLGAQLCVRLIVVLLAGALLIVVGRIAFGIRNEGSYLAMAGLQLLGAVCFMSLGYVLASFAKTPETYNGIANLVFLPLMLLSGVYFSLDGAPAWLQRMAELLPLTPLLQVLRAIFNDGAALASQSKGIAIVAVWTCVLFALATRRFRWV